MLVANLLGVGGLVGIAVSAGGLTGNWWWTVLSLSIAAVVLSVVTGLDARARGDESPEPVEQADPFAPSSVAEAT